MNKTFNINLGGYPFSIDEDAYDYVRRYLASIRQHFSASEGCEEILYDIEVRMAELFQEHLGSRQIIGMKEVDEVIAIMGKPEDFGAEPIVDNASAYARQRGGSGRIQTGKRFFRNPDDKKLGGVCSGIAAYFGVEDPLWIRLLFIALLFTGGFGVITYLILWILVPEASTTADKLAMKGEPATIENIAKAVEDEFNELGERINEWGSDSGKKKSNESAASGIKGFLSSAVNFIGQVAGAIITLVVALIKILVVFIGAVIILVLLALIIALTAASSIVFPFIGTFTSVDGFNSYFLLISAFLLVGIPLFAVILTGIRLVSRYRPARITYTIMTVVWITAIISASYFASSSVREYTAKATETSTSVHYIQSPDIIINVPSAYDDFSGMHFGDVIINEGDSIMIRDVSFEVMPSQDSLIYIEKTVSSRGRNKNAAKESLSSIQHSIKVAGNEISFLEYLSISEDSKFRNQAVDYIIKIPASKNIVYKGEARDILNDNVY
jgi:phage shock protein PspC (stress-responsive transcriptional regulator)